MTYNVKIDETIASLKEFADFLSANYQTLKDVGFDVEFSVINVTPEELKALASCPRPFDNRWQKDGDSDYFSLTTTMGSVEFKAFAARDKVCQAVPTGRTVTQRQVVKAAEFEDVEVPEMAWVCEPLLHVGHNGTVDADTETADF